MRSFDLPIAAFALASIAGCNTASNGAVSYGTAAHEGGVDEAGTRGEPLDAQDPDAKSVTGDSRAEMDAALAPRRLGDDARWVSGSSLDAMMRVCRALPSVRREHRDVLSKANGEEHAFYIQSTSEVVVVTGGGVARSKDAGLWAPSDDVLAISPRWFAGSCALAEWFYDSSRRSRRTDHQLGHITEISSDWAECDVHVRDADDCLYFRLTLDPTKAASHPNGPIEEEYCVDKKTNAIHASGIMAHEKY